MREGSDNGSKRINHKNGREAERYKPVRSGEGLNR